MKTRIALLSGLVALVAGAAAAIPTTTIPEDQDIALMDLLEKSPAPPAIGFPEASSEIPLQISVYMPFPCTDGPFGPLLIVFRPGPTTGPFDPTSCVPFPWPF